MSTIQDSPAIAQADFAAANCPHLRQIIIIEPSVRVPDKPSGRAQIAD